MQPMMSNFVNEFNTYCRLIDSLQSNNEEGNKEIVIALKSIEQPALGNGISESLLQKVKNVRKFLTAETTSPACLQMKLQLKNRIQAKIRRLENPVRVSDPIFNILSSIFGPPPQEPPRPNSPRPMAPPSTPTPFNLGARAMNPPPAAAERAMLGARAERTMAGNEALSSFIQQLLGESMIFDDSEEDIKSVPEDLIKKITDLCAYIGAINSYRAKPPSASLLEVLNEMGEEISSLVAKYKLSRDQVTALGFKYRAVDRYLINGYRLSVRG